MIGWIDCWFATWQLICVIIWNLLIINIHVRLVFLILSALNYNYSIPIIKSLYSLKQCMYEKEK